MQHVTATRKRVLMVLELNFQGDYYDASEVAGMAENWIDSGLTDRDNLRGWRVVTSATEETETEEEDE